VVAKRGNGAVVLGWVNRRLIDARWTLLAHVRDGAEDGIRCLFEMDDVLGDVMEVHKTWLIGIRVRAKCVLLCIQSMMQTPKLKVEHSHCCWCLI
jgi:hypothetical protein